MSCCGYAPPPQFVPAPVAVMSRDIATRWRIRDTSFISRDDWSWLSVEGVPLEFRSHESAERFRNRLYAGWLWQYAIVEFPEPAAVAP